MTTHQQQIHEERESERQRIEAAMTKPGTVSAGFVGGVGGVKACDLAGRTVYVQLATAVDTMAIIAELIEVYRLQLEAEKPTPADTEIDNAPPTERSGHSSNPPARDSS